METNALTGFRRLLILLAGIFLSAAVVLQIFSGFQRTRMLRDADRMFDAHVRSVVVLIREGAREASVSTALLYELAQENLMTASLLIVEGRAGDGGESFPAVLYRYQRADGTITGTDIAAAPDRKALLDWMQRQPVDVLVDDGPVGDAGFICLRFEESEGRGVVCDSAGLLDEQRREAGIGPLLKGVMSGDVRYAAIQDESGILAAAPYGIRLSSFSSDPVLATVRQGGVARSRLNRRSTTGVYEGLAPFDMEDGSRAVLRVGMDATALLRLKENAEERWLTMTLLTIGLSMIAFSAAFFTYRAHRRSILSEQAAAAEEMRAHWELIGGLAASVAHEVRNPLNTIKMVNTRLAREMHFSGESPEIREMLDITAQETERVEAVVQGFLELGKPHRVSRSTVSILQRLQELTAGMAMSAERRGARLSLTVPEDLCFPLDATLFDRIVRNLVSNALDAVAKGGEVTVIADEQQDGLLLRVIDTGPGMSAEQIERALRPFQTTKASGVGLGLPIVARSVSLLEGEFRLRSESGSGTEAWVVLPRKEA